jgi:MFS family permease
MRLIVTDSRPAVRRLALGRLISLTGGGAAYMALNFLIYQKTQSATWVAAALFLTFGAIGFAGPFAGAIGDRFDRRRVMVASDLAAAACFAAMAFVDSPGLLLAIAFCSALAEAPFFAASSAAIPNLVDEENLGWANGLVSLGRNGGILIGPLMGGLLVATVGSGSVFLLNAASFVVSAAIVATVRGRFASDRVGDEYRGLRAGFRFMFGDRILRVIALAWLAVTLTLGMSMVADVPLVDLFGTGSFGYGLLISCWGGGTVAGSLLGRFMNARNEPQLFVAGNALVALSSLAVGLSPWWWLILAAILAMGLGDGLSLVAEQGIMQRRTPDAVRARVSGAFDAVLHSGLALSFLLAGPAVAWLGPQGVYLVGGVGTFIGVAIALPILRSRRPAAPAEPAVEHADAAAKLLTGEPISEAMGAEG